MTIRPLKRASSMLRRIASTAAWSAELLSPCPIQWAAAMAAASVIRTSSRLDGRSSGMRLSGAVPCVVVAIGGLTLVRPVQRRMNHTLGRSLDEWQRIGHGLRDRNALARNRDRVERQRLVARPDASGDAGHGNPRAARSGRDRTGELAETRLPIDATLAGDDQAGAFQVRREVDGTQHEVRARYEAGVEEREEPRTKPTRRARPGHVPDRTADKALDHVGVARERAVELGDDLGRRALLRTVA